MKRVGSRLRDVVDYRAHVTPVLSAIVGHNLQFGYRILIAEEDRRASHRVVIVRLPVKLVIVGASTLPIDRNFCAIVVAETGIAGSRNAGNKQSQRIQSVAHWQVSGLLRTESRG